MRPCMVEKGGKGGQFPAAWTLGVVGGWDGGTHAPPYHRGTTLEGSRNGIVSETMGWEGWRGSCTDLDLRFV